MISEWLELDAEDDWVRHDAEIVRTCQSFFWTLTKCIYAKALRQEIAYASYLNIQTIILPPPRNRPHVASYARIINACLTTTAFLNFSVRLPVYNPSVLIPEPPAGQAEPSILPTLIVSGNTQQSLSTAPENEVNASWEMWDVIRSICNYNTRLTLSKDPPYVLASAFNQTSVQCST